MKIPIDISVSTEITRTPRVRQLEAMFDVPPAEKLQLHWQGELALDFDWNIGLIVGPSGCGKTQILERCFGSPLTLGWDAGSVVDDFAGKLQMSQIAEVCQAVGFNTIPAWMRPYFVLSNGEKFRVELAKRLLEDARDIITIDEFTSVVDRQVAQIAAYAVAKYARRHGRKVVAASCHYDIIEWLQPDWLFEPALMRLTRRSLQRRPTIEVEISRVKYEAWRLFAPFHYLTPELNHAARCYGLFVGDRITSFAGLLHRPHAKVRDITGISRVVTLPDWQGLGLAMVLLDTLGSALKAVGRRLHNYPAHPAFIRTHARSKNWEQVKAGGDYSPRRGTTSTVAGFGGRHCAVFKYIGPAMAKNEAEKLLEG